MISNVTLDQDRVLVAAVPEIILFFDREIFSNSEVSFSSIVKELPNSRHSLAIAAASSPQLTAELAKVSGCS
ncbi:hypothetical protein [Phenylobacterium sp.]|uniref:hypothetical protein n=1 Tax=Phenylobacterium sp. TaxID=1871053 RepID=UPI002FC85FA5